MRKLHFCVELSNTSKHKLKVQSIPDNTHCTPVNHNQNNSMQRYAHLDVNLTRRRNIRILTFMTLKMTLKLKIQRGIHPHLFQYTMNY